MQSDNKDNSNMMLWDMWENLMREDETNIIQQLRQIYKPWPHYILSIRMYFPNWVENQQKCLEAINTTNPDYLEAAKHICGELQATIREAKFGAKIESQLQLDSLGQYLQEESCDPMRVISALKQGLVQEQELLKSLSKDIYEKWEQGIKVENKPPDAIATRALEYMEQLSKKLDDQFNNLRDKMIEIGPIQDTFVQSNTSFQNVNGNGTDGTNSPAKTTASSGIHGLQQITNLWKDFSMKASKLLKQLNQYSDNLYDLTKEWQLAEQHSIAGLTEARPATLDEIDKVCNKLGSLIMETSQLLGRARGTIAGITDIECLNSTDLVHVQSEIDQLLTVKAKQLQKTFIERCFVISIQPVDVKRNMQPCIVKFRENINQRSYALQTEIRALGANALGIGAPHSGLVQVTAKLAKDTELMKRPLGQLSNFGNLEHNTAMLLKDKHERVIAQFSSINVQLNQSRQRPGSKRKNSSARDLVPDQRCGMVFTTIVTVANQQYPIQLISHPLVIVTHGSQERNALGRIIWDRAFSDLNSTPYNSPDKVPLSKVAEVLSALFTFHTGTGLSEDHLRYLGIRMLDCDSLNLNMSNMVSRDKFWKDKLRQPDREYSFWVWFYSCLNLIKKYLKPEWNRRLIYGFCGKNTALDLLKQQQNGTFLIRFSESEIEGNQSAEPCGYLTVALIEIDPLTERRKLYHINKDEDICLVKTEPYLSAFNFKTKRTLAQILMEIEGRDTKKQSRHALRYVYPDIPFMQAFSGQIGTATTLKAEDTKDSDLTKKKSEYVKTNTHRSLELAMEGCVIDDSPRRSGYNSERSVASPDSVGQNVIVSISGDELTPLTGERFDDVMELIKEESSSPIHQPLHDVGTAETLSPENIQGTVSGACLPNVTTFMKENLSFPPITSFEQQEISHLQFLTNAAPVVPEAHKFGYEHDYGAIVPLTTGAGEVSVPNMMEVERTVNQSMYQNATSPMNVMSENFTMLTSTPTDGCVYSDSMDTSTPSQDMMNIYSSHTPVTSMLNMPSQQEQQAFTSSLQSVLSAPDMVAQPQQETPTNPKAPRLSPLEPYIPVTVEESTSSDENQR